MTHHTYRDLFLAANRLLRDPSIGAAAKLAYLWLHGQAEGQPDEILVSPAHLGAELGRDARSARDWLTTLEQHGLVEVAERSRRGVWHVYVFAPCPGERRARPNPQMTLDYTGVFAQKPPQEDESAGVFAQKPPRESVNTPISACASAGARVSVCPSLSSSTTTDETYRLSADQEREAVDLARDVLRATWPDTPADRETREIVTGAAVIIAAEETIRPDWLTVAARVTRQRATRNPRRFLLSTLANRLAESERYCPADQAPATLDAMLRRAQPIVDRVYRRPPPADQNTPLGHPESVSTEV